MYDNGIDVHAKIIHSKLPAVSFITYTKQNLFKLTNEPSKTNIGSFLF